MALLHWHAGRNKVSLQLSNKEILDTRYSSFIWGTHAIFGLASALFALAMPAQIAVFAGFVYFFLGVAIPILAQRYGKQVKVLAISEANNED